MKCISVPVSLTAMHRLKYDECIDGDLVEIYFNDEEYNALWDTNVFNAINKSLHINIDDYEDEGIVNIGDLCKTQSLIKKMLLGDSSNQLLKLLLSQVERAISFNTGVFFFF